MATPQPTHYSAPAGRPLAAGRLIYPHATLDLIAAAPPNAWIRLNTNRFVDAASPADSRWVTGGSGPESPQAIMRSWAGVAWDNRRQQLVLWGGGHANSWANETYVWSAFTREWSLAYYCTDVVMSPGRPVDGNHSPQSSHTYSSNQYLPILDRFFTGGGAEQPGGAAMRVWDGDTAIRFAGGYTLDMSLAGQGFVGGLPDSNCKHGTWAGISLPGARAWKLRDFWDGRDVNAPAWLQPSRIEHGAAVTEENGHDVMYAVITSRLFRIEFVDDDPEHDLVSQVAGYEPDQHTNGATAYDPVRKLLVIPTGNSTSRRLNFVDRKAVPHLGMPWSYVASYPDEVALGYMGAHHKYGGIAHYPPGDCFVYWHKGRQPFLIHPPNGNPTPTTGWTLTRPVMDTETEAPPDDESSTNTVGVSGKFRYAAELGCCLAVRGDNDGNVWALKLAGWTDPRG